MKNGQEQDRGRYLSFSTDSADQVLSWKKKFTKLTKERFPSNKTRKIQPVKGGKSKRNPLATKIPRTKTTASAYKLSTSGRMNHFQHVLGITVFVRPMSRNWKSNRRRFSTCVPKAFNANIFAISKKQNHTTFWTS